MQSKLVFFMKLLCIEKYDAISKISICKKACACYAASFYFKVDMHAPEGKKENFMWIGIRLVFILKKKRNVYGMRVEYGCSNLQYNSEYTQ